MGQKKPVFPDDGCLEGFAYVSTGCIYLNHEIVTLILMRFSREDCIDNDQLKTLYSLARAKNRRSKVDEIAISGKTYKNVELCLSNEAAKWAENALFKLCEKCGDWGALLYYSSLLSSNEGEAKALEMARNDFSQCLNEWKFRSAEEIISNELPNLYSDILLPKKMRVELGKELVVARIKADDIGGLLKMSENKEIPYVVRAIATAAAIKKDIPTPQEVRDKMAPFMLLVCNKSFKTAYPKEMNVKTANARLH